MQNRPAIPKKPILGLLSDRSSEAIKGAKISAMFSVTSNVAFSLGSCEAWATLGRTDERRLLRKYVPIDTAARKITVSASVWSGSRTL
ncbi:hypothetical protein D3C79_893010 [compost metagenome]